MTAKELQEIIFSETSIKTSVRKGTGSMKGYISIRPIFQSGKYPNYPHDFIQSIRERLKPFDYAKFPLFCTISEISIYGIDDERTEYKKERKPKPTDPNKPSKGWGSKNSQMRLDKSASRHHKKVMQGKNVPRYW